MDPAPPQQAAARPRAGRWRFAHLLHASYWHGAKLNFFVSRRIRPAGVGLALVMIPAGFLCIGYESPPVFQIFSFCLALGAIGLPWALLRRAKLEARRHHPPHATVGEALHFTVEILNRGRRPLRKFWIAETPADPRPARDEFSSFREPGEERRNWFDRTFAYYRWEWLLHRMRLFDTRASERIERLAPGARERLSLSLVPRRRGVIRLDDLRVLLPDPFGLFQGCRRVSQEPSCVTVLPRRFRLPPVVMPGLARFQIGADSTANAVGSSGEFVGLRDYRPGDPPRQIHWKSWARTGRPIVKELEDNHYPRHGLVLDTFHRARGDTVFEDAVSIAASFASAIDTRESLLDLMFIRDEAHVVTVGRGVERVERLLEVLASVEPEPGGGLDELAKLVLRYRDELTSCLVVLCSWDEERAAFIHRLRAGGILCAVLGVGNGDPPPGFPGHWLESGHLERDLRRMPAELSARPN